MKKYTLLILTLCMHCIARGQTAHYWFDTQTGEDRQLTSVVMGQFEVDVSGLKDGVHTLHYQATDTEGNLSPTISATFIKPYRMAADLSGAETFQCWYDEDFQNAVTGKISNGIIFLNTEGLKDGVHTLHYQATDTEGNLSPTMSATFIKPYRIAANASGAETFRCWFDEDIQNAVTGRFADGAFFLNTEGLRNGVHTVHLYAEGEYPSPTVSCTYIKFDIPEERHIERLRCVCYIDGVEVEEQMLPTTGGAVNWNVEVAQLSLGVHTQRIAVYDQNNVALTERSSVFIHIPQTEKYLTKYDYWLNDEDVMKTVELEGQPTKYNLLTMLPVVNRPIRSECFHFAVEDGVPKVYAKNDIHLRFHDARGDMTNVSGQYVDEHISQSVEATLLESGISQTVDKPATNEIKWFKMEAVRGDSLSFKLNRAATLQLFAPSGEEVLSASGSEVVKWFGCHVRENGTYYVALHDVTATSGTTVGIDYEHIDKYAVLRQDVTVVGNGGCSTITFEGNGFRDLYAVDLFTEQGGSVHHVYIGHESDATTSVVFDFTGAALGTYHAKFRFAEEDKVFNNIVTVEEARDIELATTVTYPSTFLRGTSTTYTIKIENKGNMTAYRVPFYLYISSITDESISRINIKGLNLPSLFDIVDNDSLSESEKKYLAQYSEEIGEDHYFILQKSIDEDSSDSICVRSSYFCTDICPLSEKIITINIASKDKVECWATIPDEWPSITYDMNSRRINNGRLRVESNSDSWYCCYHERIECVVNGYATAAAIGGLVAAADPELASHAALTIADCLGSFASTSVSWATDKFCGKGNDGGEKNAWDKIHSWMDGLSKAGVLTCWNPVGRVTGTIQVAMHPVVATDCFNSFTKKRPDCPPNPGGGGSSSPVQPSDPNDIFGYTAESGSHAVKDGMTDVYYRIVFENDTAFATASAHDIYVTDTLDATKFDLSTFNPHG